MKNTARNPIADLNRSLSPIDSNSEEQEYSQYTGKLERNSTEYRKLNDV